MRLRSRQASVALVALSCVTVLGIAVASFLAVSSLAMKISNRNYAMAVSKQLAEMGLERALRSFNASTFSSWTRPDITTATQTLTISSSHYGNSGLTATANMKVYHYRDTNKAVVWSALTTYAVNDFVWYYGAWYLCIAVPAVGTAPSDTTKWKAAPEAWTPYAAYQAGNIVVSGGSSYRCILANINQVPSNVTYWTASAATAWNSLTTYTVDTVAYSGGIPYRCIVGHANQPPPNTTYWLSAPVIYSEGVATLPDSAGTTIKTQLRATIQPAPLFPNALGATTLVTFSSTATIDSYNSVLSTTYNQTTTPFSATNPNLTASAVVAGGNTGGTAVALGNARVAGYVAAPSSSTTPYAPQVTNSASGVVTSNTTSTFTPATKIDLARVSRSPNIPQFDIQTVTGGGNLPASEGSGTYLYNATATRVLGTVGATTPSIYNIDATYNGGTAYSGLYFNSGNTLRIDGPVILNVTGPLYTNSGTITIQTTGSLEVYFTGQLYVGTSAATGIQNLTLDPKKCILVSTYATNTSNINYYWANALPSPTTSYPFYGVIYMPNAYVNTWSNVDIRGAISAKYVGYPQGGSILHYDTSLRTAGKLGTFIDGPYQTVEWRELTDPTEKITLP